MDAIDQEVPMHDLQHCKSIGCAVNWRSEELNTYCPSCRDKQSGKDANPLQVAHFGHLRSIDPHRVNHLFKINHPCLQEAVSNLLESGKAVGEWHEELVDNAMKALNRWQEMTQEDKQGAAILAGE